MDASDQKGQNDKKHPGIDSAKKTIDSVNMNMDGPSDQGGSPRRNPPSGGSQSGHSRAGSTSGNAQTRAAPLGYDPAIDPLKPIEGINSRLDLPPEAYVRVSIDIMPYPTSLTRIFRFKAGPPLRVDLGSTPRESLSMLWSTNFGLPASEMRMHINSMWVIRSSQVTR